MNQMWQVKRLGDVVKTGAGGTPRKSNKEYYDGGDIPWLLSGEVAQGLIYESKNFITKKGLESSSAKLFPENTVLVAMYGATVGQVGVLKCEASTNQAVCGIYPSETFSPEFLYYFFLSKRDDFISQAVGNAQPNISQIKIKNTNIPVPPLEEQKQIVAVLDKAFAAIDQAKANIEKNLQNAKELFQSKLNEIFCFDKLSNQSDGTQTDGDKGGALSQSKGEGWEEKKLGDASLVSIIDGDRGKNYPKKSDFFTEGHCVFMNTGNVRPNGFDFNTVMFITKERDQLLRKGKLQRDDVVMTTRGTIGNLGWYNDAVKYDEIRINSGMLIFRVNKKNMLPEYLFADLRSPLVTKQI